MATTLQEIETELSLNLGENIIPTDVYERNRRRQWINRGQKALLGDFYWWFLRKRKGFVAHHQTIDVGDDVRDIYRVYIEPFIYTPEKDFENFSYWIPRGFFKTFRFINQQITLADTPPIPAQAKFTFSITSNGLIAQCTALNHGLKVGDMVMITGANQPPYNGDYEVISTTDDSFSFRIAIPALPATGEISFTKCNVVIDYFAKATNLADSGDVTLIPDEYAMSLADYGEHKFHKIRGKRASASDALEAFNSTLMDMKKEHMRQMVYYKKSVNRDLHLCIP